LKKIKEPSVNETDTAQIAVVLKASRLLEIIIGSLLLLKATLAGSFVSALSAFAIKRKTIGETNNKRNI
jgi:hypothetical protein